MRSARARIDGYRPWLAGPAGRLIYRSHYARLATGRNSDLFLPRSITVKAVVAGRSLAGNPSHTLRSEADPLPLTAPITINRSSSILLETIGSNGLCEGRSITR